MVPSRALIAGVAALAVASACSREPPQLQRAPSAAERAARAAFERGEADWRAQRREELLAPDGWTSLVGLHWITPGAHYVGRDRDNGIRLSVGPGQFGMLDLRAGRVRFVPHAAADLQLDGRPLRGAVVLRADDAVEGASRLTFDAGDGVATVIRRGDRYALRVRHAGAASRTRFAGLQYWPGGPDWAVPARFERHPPGRTLPIANIVGTIEPTANPGAVRFERGGVTYRLEALEGKDGGLFLIFADRTSGHGSYGAGRYLDTAAPDANGRVRIDFNRAYNPPCAFTSFATCPLPPPENRLDLAITAGEKAYAGNH
jgi:uncharacterized protein (DUF1684 family)